MSRGAAEQPNPADGGKPNELRALGTLAFSELARAPGAIRNMHLGIAARAFSGVAPAANGVRAIHDTLTRRAYDAIATATELLGHAADEGMQQAGLGEDVSLSSTPAGGIAVAALGGLIGDELRQTRSALQQPPSVRVAGEPVTLTRKELASAFPTASKRLVVFLHGLMENELYWLWGAQDDGDTYGGRLQRELDFTPIYLRYNTGLHISESGHEVAQLIAQLIEAWPLDVDQLALIGHSMGGLVARSACHQTSEQSESWTRLVSHIVTLGTPHRGAPLAQGVHTLAWALGQLPETRPLAGFLRRRSAGIRDLSHGSLVDEDWRGRDPDALRAAALREVPLLAGTTHCFVSATVTANPSHPLGRALGDILVLTPSAHGHAHAQRASLRPQHLHHVGSAHHFALLNHPDIHARLTAWLDPSARERAAHSNAAQRAARPRADDDNQTR